MGTHQRGTLVEKLWENCHNPAYEGFSRSDFRMSGSKFESTVKLLREDWRIETLKFSDLYLSKIKQQQPQGDWQMTIHMEQLVAR